MLIYKYNLCTYSNTGDTQAIGDNWYVEVEEAAQKKMKKSELKAHTHKQNTNFKMVIMPTDSEKDEEEATTALTNKKQVIFVI